MSVSEPLSDLQLGVLALVRDGGDKANWHHLGTRAASLAPHGAPVPDVMAVLKDLQQQGLLSREMAGGGMDLWALTAAGRAALEEAERRPPPPGPLERAELRKLAAALKSDATTSTRALLPYIDDGPRLRAALMQVVALDPANARAAASAGLFLRPGDQAELARAMLADPRPEVRAALFKAWSPPRNEVPGMAVPTLDGPVLDELLQKALLDLSRDVRASAAAYAFASGRGEALVGELMANVEAPERELRCWTILALGGARDPVSLGVLEQIAGEPDMAAAAVAVRALAARPDGHAAWLRVLEGPDGELRRAALFALAEVARHVSLDARTRLGQDAREDTRKALSRYHSRAETTS